MKVFLLELKTTKKSVLRCTIIVSAIVFMMLAFFPSMQTESMRKLASAKMEGINPALLEALGLTAMIDFTIITNFFGYVLQFITLAVMVYITQQAVSALIREETDGTIEFLYARPLSRSDIYLQKLAAHVLSYLFMLLIFAILTIIGYLSFSDYSLGQTLREAAIMYGSLLFVGLVFLSAGFFTSTLLHTNKGSSGITIALVFGTFILGIMSVLIHRLDFLIYLSPMDWIKTQKLMSEGIRYQEWCWGILVILLSLTAGYFHYRRKDLRIE